MTLWKFFSTQSSISFPRVVAIAVVSGLSNAFLLAIVNSAAHYEAADTNAGDQLRLFAMFVVAILLYVLSQRYILRVSGVEVETIILRVRVRLAEKIRRADLQALEGLGRSQLYAAVSTETVTISQATAPIIIACQAAIMIAFSLFYIYWLSPVAFLMTVAIIAVGVVIHLRDKRRLMADLARATARENDFFDSLTHLIEGFKEVRLSRSRNDGLFDHLSGVARSVADLKSATSVKYADYYIFTQLLFFLLIGAMAFLLTGIDEGAVNDRVTSITAAILFIMGPVAMVVSAVQIVANADNSVKNIAALEAKLDEALRATGAREDASDAPLTEFEVIELAGLEFAYYDLDDKQVFKAGPLELDIRSGEILFIVGGNGSGKSTFLKLLTALYFPSAGKISVDGVDIGHLGYQNYRELFTAIFSDYHLFDRLYGVSDVEPRRILSLLQMMQLQNKTSWRDGRFDNLQLSSGQRKRLALIVSLIDDKPITVFDEWAADQDPEFREYFYRSLVPKLKQQGKTVVAATHDDRYFDVADRVIKMEMGRFVPVGKADA